MDSESRSGPLTGHDAFVWPEALAVGGPEWSVRRWVGLDDCTPAGVAILAAPTVGTGGLASGLIYVRSDTRRRGVGTALRAAVEAAARLTSSGVVYVNEYDDPETEAAVAAWGLDPPVADDARHGRSTVTVTFR